MFADGRKAVVRSDKNIRVGSHSGITVDVIQNLFQVIVGIFKACPGSRSVDARDQLVQTIPLKVLRSIRIARPVKYSERLSALLEHWQNDSRQGVYEISLLLNIRICGSRSRIISRRLLSERCRRGQALLLQRGNNLQTQRNSVGRTGPVIDNHSLGRRKFTLDGIQ